MVSMSYKEQYNSYESEQSVESNRSYSTIPSYRMKIS
jgi:hypothetical protein